MFGFHKAKRTSLKFVWFQPCLFSLSHFNIFSFGAPHSYASLSQKEMVPCTMKHSHKSNYFPVLLRTTKLAQSTSQYHFVLQSSHKVLPSTTSYYKTPTSTYQYYFVRQSSHKVLPSTTSYYKARTKYVPALLRTTKLAHTTSQYYFVLQSSHKVLPSTTSYYKVLAQRKRAFAGHQGWCGVEHTSKSQFYISFCRSNVISCKMVAADTLKSQFYRSFCRSIFSFVRKGCNRTFENRNFTAVFDDQTSFRAKGLHFVAPPWHCPAP